MYMYMHVLLYSYLCTYILCSVRNYVCTLHPVCTFQGRVHDFQRCAPGLFQIYQPFIITTYKEGARRSFRVHSSMRSASGGCTIQNLNFGHCYAYINLLFMLYIIYHIQLFRGEITPLTSSYNISGLVPLCWLLFQCF